LFYRSLTKIDIDPLKRVYKLFLNLKIITFAKFLYYNALGKFDSYNIDLKSLPQGVHCFKYPLQNQFFLDIDGTEVQKGKLSVDLSVKCSSAGVFEMSFQIEGVVFVPCDRCLDEVEVSIETQNRLVVKFGEEYAEESDEVVVIPEDEGAINLAWFIYEFIALAVPAKHIHAPGKCNKGMSAKLKKHSSRSADDDEMDGDMNDDDSIDDDISSDNIDSRWDALKGLIDNDNNN